MSLGMPDAVSSVLATALDGLSARQNVIADNIANVDTPGFRARAVEFESNLAAAIQRGEMPANGVSVSTMPTNAAADNVSAAMVRRCGRIIRASPAAPPSVQWRHRCWR